MKYIIITGVSSGIGLATAKLFTEKGHFVFGSVRTQTDADRLKNDLGDTFEPLIFDVSDAENVKKAVKIVENRVGTEGVSLLVNNAGIAVSGPLKHIDTADIEHQFNINVFGVQRVTQAFLPLLGADLKTNITGKGMIINVSSVSAYVTSPFLAPYSASKIAMEYLTDGLRRELSIYGIKVVIVEPGPVKTPIWDKAKTAVNYYPTTDYAAAVKDTEQNVSRIADKAIDVEIVATLIMKIYNMQKPSIRYIVGFNPLLIKFISILPTRWVDALLTRRLKKSITK